MRRLFSKYEACGIRWIDCSLGAPVEQGYSTYKFTSLARERLASPPPTSTPTRLGGHIITTNAVMQTIMCVHEGANLRMGNLHVSYDAYQVQ